MQAERGPDVPGPVLSAMMRRRTRGILWLELHEERGDQGRPGSRHGIAGPVRGADIHPEERAGEIAQAPVLARDPETEENAHIPGTNSVPGLLCAGYTCPLISMTTCTACSIIHSAPTKGINTASERFRNLPSNTRDPVAAPGCTQGLATSKPRPRALLQGGEKQTFFFF